MQPPRGLVRLTFTMDAPSSPLYPLRGTARLSYYLQRLSQRTRHWRFCDYLLIAQPRRTLPIMPKAYSVVRATDAELRAHQRLFHLSTATLRWRRAQAMDALMALRDGKPVGLIWLGRQGFEEDEAPLRFHLPPGGAWDTGLYIPPRERHRRAWTALWAGVAHWMQTEGIETCYSRINPANSASLASHRRMGARILGRLYLIQSENWLWAPTHHILPRRRTAGQRLDIGVDKG